MAQQQPSVAEQQALLAGLPGGQGRAVTPPPQLSNHQGAALPSSGHGSYRQRAPTTFRGVTRTSGTHSGRQAAGLLACCGWRRPTWEELLWLPAAWHPWLLPFVASQQPAHLRLPCLALPS